MNISSVSSAKCGSSDFSIERILSESSSRESGEDTPSWLCCTRYQPPRIPQRNLSDNSSLESGEDTPSWLCCTRYQPPRIPRGSNVSRARRSGRHARVPFTGAQAAALEAAYSRAPYLAPPALRALAAALHLRDDRIKIWFQNRRARERREKSGSITPPRAVTLPSTASPPTTSNSWTAVNNQALHASFNIRPNMINNIVEVSRNSYSIRTDINNFEEGTASGPKRYFRQSYSSTSDESNGSRCDSPLDVEAID